MELVIESLGISTDLTVEKQDIKRKNGRKWPTEGGLTR